MAASMATAISDKAPSASDRRFKANDGRTTQLEGQRSRVSRRLQCEFDHGVFLATSRFSKEATEASYMKGAITILLLDTPATADILLERGLGVRKLPLFLYDIDEEFFDLDDE